MTGLDKSIKALENAKQKLKDQERRLIEKQRRTDQQKMLKFGRLLYKANIPETDEETLLGALLEISDQMNDEAKKQKWRERVKAHKSTDGVRLIISFKTPPPDEVKKKLRDLNFKWNTFRGEYYGLGEKRELNALLKGIECKIEEIG